MTVTTQSHASSTCIPAMAHAPAERQTCAGFAPSSAAEAVMLYHQGRYGEALHVASAALHREPRNAALWNAGAAAAFALGLFAEAEQFWTVAIRLDPTNAEAHANLGVLHTERGDLAGAEQHLQRAVSLDPGHAGALGNLGAVLVELHRYEEAMQAIRRSTTLAGENAEALNNLGLALMHLGRLAEADACLKRSIALKPGFIDTLASSALLHLQRGDDAAALQGFEAVLALDPANAKAHLFKAEQTRATPGAWMDALQTAHHHRSGRPLREVIQLDFAMGKLCEDLGRYDDAFEAYAEGNRLHHAQHPVDERSEQRHLESTLREFDAAALTVAEQPQPGEDDDAPIPVFIVGMPRSGTTLVEQILATHPGVFGAGELTLIPDLLAPPFPRQPPPESAAAWRQQVRELGHLYLERRPRPCRPATHVIDKLPGNYQHLGLIRLMLPQARIIHMRRDPLDVCFSCFALHFAIGHAYAYDQGTLGRQYVRYHQLMAHWRTLLPANCLLEVEYESLIADTERETRRILDFLGLTWYDRCTRFHENPRLVHTASRAQVRQPIYSRSVGRAKRFEKHLAPLQRELAALPATSVT